MINLFQKKTACLPTAIFQSILLFSISFLCPLSQASAQCTQGDCNNGTGTYLFKSGAKFIGEFKDKQMSFGVYHYTNNDIYKGSYQNNKREGEGEYFYGSGNYFKGTYKNGKKINGIFKYVDGSVYDGDFYNDKKSGKGALTTAAGESYVGYWKNDKYIGEEADNPVVIHALIVAIADYKNGNDLTFTVNDARKFNDFILSGAMGGDETKIEMLLNQQASKGNILRIMDELFSKADKK